MEIYFFVQNVKNLYVMNVKKITQMINIISLIFKNMIQSVNFIPTHMILIVLNVKKIYVFIVSLNMKIII